MTESPLAEIATLPAIEPTPVPVRAYRYHIPEITVRTVGENTMRKELRKCSNAGLCYSFFNEVITAAPWYDPEKECTVAVLLDRKNVVKSWTLITLGTATSALLHPREAFRAAVVASATAIVVMHNHPSGDPAPSSADVQITHMLREAAKTLEITLLDHVIAGQSQSDPLIKGYYSFRESGLL